MSWLGVTAIGLNAIGFALGACAEERLTLRLLYVAAMGCMTASASFGACLILTGSR